MNISVIDFSEKDLWDGAKVKDLRTDKIRTIKFLGEDKGLYQSILAGEFIPNENVEYSFVMNNKHLFELVDETEE